jgi:hypothetical protein
MIKVNKENYYSKEVNKEYMSVSLFKSFLEDYGGCEARTIAIMNGEWEEQPNPAFVLGSYVHAWNEGKLEEFKEQHPEIVSSRGKTKGQLKKEFVVAENMIKTLKKDKLVSKVRQGDKEVILTAELFGVPWKCAIDIYNPNFKTIVDLKTTRDIRKKYYNKYEAIMQNFIKYYGYDIQMAIYAEIERLATGSTKYCMPHILAVSKEDIPDKAIINMGKDFIKPTLETIEIRFDRVKDVWRGKEKPIRCEHCDYCKATKQLKEIIFWEEL